MTTRSVPFALFLDFDGVLADIVDRPGDVIVEADLVGNLARLQARLDGALAIVTGRRIAQIDLFLNSPTLDVSGLHGLEMRWGIGQGPASVGEAVMRPIVAGLHAKLDSLPGVLIEDKGATVALHWREAPEFFRHVSAAAEDALEILGGGYRLQPGKAVIEIVPAEASKGAAIRRFMQDRPYRGRRPIFCGDDLTDEAGFAAVNDMGGLSIRIGEGETRAKMRLESGRTFRRVLAEWADGGDVLAALEKVRPVYG